MKIEYEGRSCSVAEGETVLDALLRAGFTVPYGCRAGSCQSCLLRVVEGQPPAKAREGLTPAQVEQRLFLPCVCEPVAGLSVVSPAAVLPRVPAVVEQVDWLGADVIRVMLRTSDPFSFRAGQFLNLFRSDGLARSYSIASLPESGGALELHVRVLPRGAMSQWLASAEARGARVEVRGPGGQCVYCSESPEEVLILAGTGTGLAPLLGVVRDAAARGHRGPIYLLHGSGSPRGWYLNAELESLADAVAGLSYVPCLRDATERAPALDSQLRELAAGHSGARFYLCGAPKFVQSARKKLFLSGASLRRIHVDAFVVAPAPAGEAVTSG